jgi:hypothetical protein
LNLACRRGIPPERLKKSKPMSKKPKRWKPRLSKPSSRPSRQTAQEAERELFEGLAKVKRFPIDPQPIPAARPNTAKPEFAELTSDMSEEQMCENLKAALIKSGFTITKS